MPTTVHITDKADQIISGIKDFSQGLSINNNYLFYSQPSGFFSGVGISGSGDGGYFIGKTKLSQNTLILKDESFGKNSVAEDSIRNWQSVAISANGQYQTAVTNIAGFIYVSNDYGDTWRQKASALSWFRIAMSADGKYQTASTYNAPFGFIYTSDNYGQTWTQLPTQETSIQGIAMSSDGKVQIFVTYTTSEYKISKDYGKTWTNGTVVSASGVKGVAISNDGKYITIVGAGSSDRIYISSNYGSSWTTIGSIGTWNSVAMSSDGKFQAAARGGTGFIYISNNYGNTWSIKNNSGSRLWLSISMSSDGKYIAATTDGTYNYVSYDYGENWTVSYINNRIAGSSATCYDIDVSSDGKYMLTAAQGGYIYLSKTEEKVNGNLYADNLIYNTGNQTISGDKTFVKNTPFSSGSFKIYGGGVDEYNLEFSKSSREYATFSIVAFQKSLGSANPANVTTSQPHNFRAGDTVTINDIRTTSSSCNISALNGSYIISDITSSTTFQYLVPGNETSAQSSLTFALILSSCLNAPIAASYSYYSKTSSLIGDFSLNSKNIISDSPFIAPNLLYNSGNQTISSGNLTVNGNIINSKIADQFPAWTGVRRYPPLDLLSVASNIPVSGTVNYFPFLIKKNVVDPVACVEMTTYLNFDPKIDIGIYSGDYGFQDAKLIASGSITGSILNTGIYRTKLNGTFNKGPYIVASMLSTGQGSTFRILGSHGFREHFGINTGSSILHGLSSTTLTNILAETGLSILPQKIGSGEWYVTTSTVLSPLVFLEY